MEKMMRIKLTTLLIAAAAFVAVVPAPAFAQRTPTQAQTDAARRSGPCDDPWITLAIAEATAGGFPVGKGGQDQCAPELYGGTWSSYQALFGAVDSFLRGLDPKGLAMRMMQGQPTLLVVDPAKALAAGLIGQDAANLISKGGAGSPASIVAAGGGNIVAAGGGNIVAGGGGNYRITATGGSMAIPLPSGKRLIVTKR